MFHIGSMKRRTWSPKTGLLPKPVNGAHGVIFIDIWDATRCIRHSGLQMVIQTKTGVVTFCYRFSGFSENTT